MCETDQTPALRAGVWLRQTTIIHGNLHSKNIFLTSTLVAKVGDFVFPSVSKASGPFAPQIALCDHLTPSLDVFAFGCVVCHVITQQLPVPSGGISLNEVQLRQHYIDQIELEPLKELVISCLQNKSEYNFAISDVCRRITSIKG